MRNLKKLYLREELIHSLKLVMNGIILLNSSSKYVLNVDKLCHFQTKDINSFSYIHLFTENSTNGPVPECLLWVEILPLIRYKLSC
jgi:hypothetical protein